MGEVPIDLIPSPFTTAYQVVAFDGAFVNVEEAFIVITSFLDLPFVIVPSQEFLLNET